MLKSKHYKISLFLALAASVWASAHGQAQAAGPSPQLPVLNWQERSDWVNVKTDVKPAAVGDGVHDDTAAIQAALNRLNSKYTNSTKTVYFPAGTYRITNTLSLTQVAGTTLIGTGRTTRIVWGGAANLSMFRSNGVTRARYVGLTWDGAHTAGVGIDHQSHTYYESRVRHQDEAFLNFRVAGIRLGQNQVTPTAEVLYRNCLFQNSGTGVSILAFNDYNNDFDGCDFRDCGTALNCAIGNVYVRECHFERSSIVDIWLFPHSSSIRRCTSIGSAQFLNTPYTGASAETTVQDCHIDGWTGKKGAMNFALRGPTTVFDTSFTHPPDTAAPIRLTNAGTIQQIVTLSNNSAPNSSALFVPAGNIQVVQLPAGAHGPSLSNPSQTFFQATETLPSAVLDVKTQFGAKGDGHADDTAAINQAIAAAKKRGGNCLVYLPPGLYNVSSTIPVTGGGYTLGGSGYWTVMQWVGKPTGVMFAVQDPQKVTLEQLRIAAPDAVACIQQTSTEGNPSQMTYDGVYVGGSNLGLNASHAPRANRGLECIGLSAASVVRLPHFDGSMHFTNCSEATIVAGFTADGVLQVDGGLSEKTGFLGILMRTNFGNPCDILVRDNQDLVGTNFYTEQTTSFLQASGDGAYPGQPGHITLQGSKIQTSNTTTVHINDYEGRIGILGAQFMYGTGYGISHTGSRPLDLVLLGNTFWNSDPVVTGGSALNLLQTQNVVVGETAVGGPHVTANMLPGVSAGMTETLINSRLSNPDLLPPAIIAGLSSSVEALDDFRELGAADLALNHS